ncbi:MAG TPA: CBS domain-containing protein [Nitrososphaerales archaeon]|nr:CBS domain-containing protein [Nitrososphaerales archaeon]
MPKKVARKPKRKASVDFLNRPVAQFARPPIIVFADDAVTDAAKLMRDQNAGSVLVAEKGTKDEPVGILTEWDLLSNIVAAERDASQTKVREVMSSPVQKIEANSRVGDAMRLMLKRGIRRLAVVEDGVLVGTVTQSQLAGGSRRGTSPPLTEKLGGHVCPYCNSTFPTRKKLSEHIETMHEESVFLELRDKQELENE